MKWVVRDGKLGDMVRVHVNSQLDHYGVYISDDEVIQFGLNPSLRIGASEEDCKVCATTIDEFRNGAYPEFADLSMKEKFQRFKVSKIVETARGRLGEGGYNILLNNCEHFAYECIFGKKYSSQSELVKQLIKEQATGKKVEGAET